MEITGVSATPVIMPTSADLSGSGYTKTGRGTIVVRLNTTDGPVGFIHSGDILDSSPSKADTLKSLVEDRVAPHFVGNDLMTVERCWQSAMSEANDFFAYQPDKRQLYIHALGAVNVAAWDAVGKSLQTPLYKLWGGYRESVPVIAIGGYYHSEQGTGTLAEEVKNYRDLGFAGLKLKVGGRSVDEDIERLAAVREAGGDEFVIACDANQGYTVEEAVEFGRRAADYDVEWFEEPVVWYEQYAGMAEVRRATPLPVTAGQSESVMSACRRLVDHDAVDTLNPDSSIAGGPTQWLKIARMAETANITMAHHEEPHIAMHLLAAIPNGEYIEAFHPTADPVWYELLTHRPAVSDGVIELPDEPGLGVELDRDLVNEYAVDTST